MANTSIHDRFGKHHRMGFPFNWISNLENNPSGSWDVRDNMGVIYWIYPNPVLANSSVGVEVIDILPAGSPTRISPCCRIFAPFLVAFPDFHWELSNLIAGGDWVAIEVIETATFKAADEYRPGIVIEPTGKSYACHYAICFKFATA